MFDGKETSRILSRWPTVRIFCFNQFLIYNNSWLTNLHLNRASQWQIGPLLGTEIQHFDAHIQAGQHAKWEFISALSDLNTSREPSFNTHNQGEVPAITLESWGNGLGIDLCDRLWLDLEGAGLEALYGTPSFLSHHRVIQAEISDEPFCDGAPTSSQIRLLLRRIGLNRVARSQLGTYGNERYLNFRF